MTSSISNLPIVLAIKLHHRELQENDLSFLTRKEAICLAQISLLLGSEEEKRKLPPEAQSEFFNNRAWVLGQSQEGFAKLWQSCGLSPAKLQLHEKFLKGVCTADASDKLLALSGDTLPLTRRNHVLKKTVYLIQKLSQQIEEFWKKISDDMDQTYDFMHRAQRHLPQETKQLNSLGFRGNTQITKQFNDHIISLLQRLRFYTCNHMPRISALCAGLNTENSNALRQINTLFALFLKCQNEVFAITRKIEEEVAEYEFKLAIVNGNYPRTEQAKIRCRQFVEASERAMLPTWEATTKAIHRFSYGHSLNRGITNKEKDLFLVHLEQCIKEPQKKVLDQFAKEVLVACHTAAEGYRKEIDRLLQTVLPSDKERSILTEYFSITSAMRLNHHLTTEDPSILASKTWGEFLFRINAKLTDMLACLEPAMKSDSFVQSCLSMREGTIERERESMQQKGFQGTISSKGRIDALMQKHSQTAMKSQGLRNSFELLGNLFATFSSIQRGVKQVDEKEKNLLANRTFQILEIEEAAEEQAVREAQEAAKKKKSAEDEKQKAAVATSSAVALSAVTLPSVRTFVPVPVLPSSPFASQAGQFVFELRHAISQWHGIDPQRILVPAQIAESDLSRSNLAAYTELYALDCSQIAFEALAACRNTPEEAPASQIALLWAFLMLEQGATPGYLKEFPDQLLLPHHLPTLLSGLGVDPNNIWLEEAAKVTVQYRYPWNESQSEPLALRLIREANGKTLDDFHSKKWLKDAAQIKFVVLSRQASAEQQPLLKHIHGIMESHLNVDQQSKTAAAQERIKEGRLDEALQKLGKTAAALTAPSQAEEKAALRNALHHLSMLQSALRMHARLPQQRFLHLHLQTMLIAIQYFTENLGTYLSFQQIEGGWPTHVLETYLKDYGLGNEQLNKKLLNTLRDIDVRKGSELPYHFFAKGLRHSAVMNDLSFLYECSREAVLLGGHRSGLNQVTNWANRFVQLANALVNAHFS